jgi:hypothetical protein
MGPESFTSAQQRSIGIALAQIDELIGSLRADGVDSGALSTLQDELRQIANVTGAKAPPARGSDRHAKLAQLLVYVMELDSRSLRAYGKLSSAAAGYLDDQSRRLTQLTSQLIDETEYPRSGR